MNKPSYVAVARERAFIGGIHSYAVEEHYEGEAPHVCTAGHPSRIAAEASAAALQGAIERFAERQLGAMHAANGDLVQKIKYLLKQCELYGPDGRFTFPDGDTWSALED